MLRALSFLRHGTTEVRFLARPFSYAFSFGSILICSIQHEDIIYDSALDGIEWKRASCVDAIRYEKILNQVSIVLETSSR